MPRAKINHEGCLFNSLILDPPKNCDDSDSSTDDLPQSYKPGEIKKKRKRKKPGKKPRELRKKFQLKAQIF